MAAFACHPGFSIPAGIAALQEVGAQAGYLIEASEDPCALTETALAHVRVVVFLLGTRFASHPAIQTATIRVIDSQHPVTAALPAAWTRRDEWYDFRGQPAGAKVLGELDESTYSGGQMGQHHPILWVHESGSGRCVYFAGGHTVESYAEPLFRSVLLGALRFASGDARP